MPSPYQDVERALTVLRERRPSLALDTLDLGFLVALHVRGQAAQSSTFSEPGLREVFEQVCAVLEPSAEQRSKRATYALARLRDQRLLARVDGHGVVRSGEYALTRLASGIVEFFLDDDVLTRESLGLLTATLQQTLRDVKAAAVTAAADSGASQLWPAQVTGPLRVTIAELVAGIERRQRGLDLRQEEFQSEIRRLLEADWFGALEQCQRLLESTSATLRELNELLLRDTASLLVLLHDIEQLAFDSGAHEAAAAALQLVEQIDRIAAWGGARQQAWSEYFQYVHRYLREVVRLDPTRALTQRLRDQLSGVGQRFALSLAGALPMRILRTAAPAIERPAVTRPRAAREREPALESGEDAQVVLESRVRSALESGATSLAHVTDRVNEAVDPSEHFAMTGRVAQATAALSRVNSQPERPWVRVGSSIEIEDWQLAGESEDSETAAGE